VVSIYALGCLPFSCALGGEPQASGHGTQGEILLFPSGSIRWQQGPPSLPPGAMIALLEGDPTRDGPFVFRLKLPDAYRVPPHTHPKTERVTVISGTFNIGMGDKFDEAATRPMPAGTYGYWPSGMKHFVWAKGETVLQFHGTGPWSIQYVNPADDPREKRSAAEDSENPDNGRQLNSNSKLASRQFLISLCSRCPLWLSLFQPIRIHKRCYHHASMAAISGSRTIRATLCSIPFFQPDGGPCGDRRHRRSGAG